MNVDHASNFWKIIFPDFILIYDMLSIYLIKGHRNYYYVPQRLNRNWKDEVKTFKMLKNLTGDHVQNLMAYLKQHKINYKTLST